MKAVIVVFYRYTPREDSHYLTQSELFFRLLSKSYKYFDKLYVADAGWGLTDDQLHPNTTKYTEDNRSHWHYLNELTKMALEDGATEILYLDPDILMYDEEVLMKCWVTDTKGKNELDIRAILDNSGSVDFFPANQYRAVRRRLTPYLSFIRADLLRKINIDFTPTTKDGQFEFDSMGLLTKQLLELNPRFKELPDDRTTLRLLEDGTMTKDTWLDGPGYEWSEPIDSMRQMGYYHVRNSSVGLSLLVEYEYNKEAYQNRKSVMPFQEAMRLIAWQWMYDKKTGNLDKWLHTYFPVLRDYGVSTETWNVYIEAFEGYHSWLKYL